MTRRIFHLARVPWALFVILCVTSFSGLAADAISGAQWCDRPVDKIRFQGNNITRPHVMLRELVQKQGMSCSLDDVIDGIQNIFDLGLFKSVRAELHWAGEALELRYIVSEKIFFYLYLDLAAPRTES